MGFWSWITYCWLASDENSIIGGNGVWIWWWSIDNSWHAIVVKLLQLLIAHWNGIPVEGSTLVGAISKTFEKFWGSSNYKGYQVKWLLLRAINTLEKEMKG